MSDYISIFHKGERYFPWNYGTRMKKHQTEGVQGFFWGSQNERDSHCLAGDDPGMPEYHPCKGGSFLLFFQEVGSSP